MSIGSPDTGLGAPVAREVSPRALYVGLGGALVLGGLAAAVVSLSSGAGWNDGLRWVLYMLAAAAVAVILGLIFGVPRARTDFAATETERYTSNSNLEQISDWLTKLLVGVGLVELKNVPGWAAELGAYLGAGMAVSNAAAFSIAAVVYGSGVGFLVAYLWMRLFMRGYLEAADARAAVASAARDVAKGLHQQNVAMGQSESGQDVNRAAQRALSTVRGAMERGGSLAPILWVDDNPANNTALIESFRRLGIEVDLARSTSEAMTAIARRRYGLIISDLGRQEPGGNNPHAGIDLIEQVHAQHPDMPIFIFGGQRAQEMENDLKAKGATLVTTRASTLFENAVRTVTP